MRFEVTILGSRAAKPDIKHFQTAHALNVHEQFYLIDCGEATQTQLMRYGLHPMRINHVFVSHLHGDHVYGLFPMISTMGLMGRKTPLHVYGPHPLQEVIDMHFRYFDSQLSYEVICHEVDHTQHQMVYENKVLEVWTIPLRHRVPCTGYHFREKTPGLNLRPSALQKYDLTIQQMVAAKQGEDIVLENGEIMPNEELTYTPYTARSYAYLSDTTYSAKAAHLVRGVDLMYHEATYADIDRKRARQTGHSTTLQAAKAALEAKAKQLIIGHFSGRYDENTEALRAEAATLFGNTLAATEGLRVEIPIHKNQP